MKPARRMYYYIYYLIIQAYCSIPRFHADDAEPLDYGFNRGAINCNCLLKAKTLPHTGSIPKSECNNLMFKCSKAFTRITPLVNFHNHLFRR